jgi:cytochrome o ubiquinol oxidase subunit III
MTKSLTLAQTRYPDPHQETFAKNVFGFWAYLMTDCILFATLFITYAVLHNSTFGGPTSHDLFDLSTTLAETLVLLFSSVTCGFGMLAALRNKTHRIIGWFIIAFLLGLSFVVIELTEFRHLVQEGHSWQRSAFLSSFFTLVGTHGFHVSVGLLWMIVLMVQLAVYGLTVHTFRRLVCFSLFWHFLDLVWIFIFTFVYIMGTI